MIAVSATNGAGRSRTSDMFHKGIIAAETTVMIYIYRSTTELPPQKHIIIIP